MKVLLIWAISFLMACQVGHSQVEVWTGKIIDSASGAPIGSASILVFTKNKFSGTVANTDGVFKISVTSNADSVKFSCIGYRSLLIDLRKSKLPVQPLTIKLNSESKILKEVVVKPLSALELVRQAILASEQMMPLDNFESDFFYREVIKDNIEYYSVAEAIFKTQFTPGEKNYKIKLIKGRSKEDVSRTRLFEDFHPGGGPQALFKNKLITGFPEFLTIKKLHLFNYYKDSVIRQDDKIIHIIGFDQRPDVKEALDKGKIFIDAVDHSIIKYESESSPLGIRYVKDLTGSDKLFAKLLHIDFKRKGWNKKAEFIKYNNSLYLSHAYAEYQVGYKQPKKQLELDLTINTEMVGISNPSPFGQVITNDLEWKQKDIVANLPNDFDDDFWGDALTISPTITIDSVIQQMGRKNAEPSGDKLDGKWKYFNKDFFVSYGVLDTVVLVPIRKGSWENTVTAGMIYELIAGDFSIETEIFVSKRSNSEAIPDNGFQQAGIIIRKPNSRNEHHLILSIGTSGSKNIKYFLQKTKDGVSKGQTDKVNNLHQWLRIERKENIFSAFIKETNDSDWRKIASYRLDWYDSPLEVGLITSARFAGNGPKTKPDIKARFTNIKMESAFK